MIEDADVRFNIAPVWNVVKKIRDKVESLLKDKGGELSYACKMVTSELIENAVKYGSAIDEEEGRGISFECNVDEDKIKIKVTNRVININDYENVKQRIDVINSSKKPQELYVQRLSELLENPEIGESQLGLYRIAYEGQFSLQYQFEDMVLCVTAVRSI